MMQPQSPTHATIPSATAPVVAGGVNDVQIGDAAQEFHRAQQRQLMDQRLVLENTRTTMSLQLSQMPAKAAERPLVQAQIADMDGRIAKIDGMLAQQPQAWAIDNDAFASVPPPFNYQERVLPKDIFILSAIFMVVVFFPLAVALGLRILRRGKPAEALPSGMSERLERMQTAIESTAIEVERIGEGQRYLTRVLGERSGSEELELARVEARGRISTP
jgi:hypothetical protein